MAITTNDIKLLASARMNDTADGGGQMTGTALQDGSENNVFADISSTDRAFGRLSLRKVYPAVLNSGTDTLLGAHVILDDMPDDADVDAFAFAGGSATQSRGDVMPLLETTHWAAATGLFGYMLSAAPIPGQRVKVASTAVPPWVGMVMYFAVTNSFINQVLKTVVLSVTEVLSSDGTFSSGFDSSTAGDRVFAITCETSPAAIGSLQGVSTVAAVAPARCVSNTPFVSTKAVVGTLSIGATSCDVGSLLVPLVPKQLGGAAGTSTQIGIDAAALDVGLVPAFRAGDGLVVHHTGEVAAATYANGNTINVGRTAIASFRLVGANGVSIPSGWTGNQSTGVVTVNDITGWSQPVRVRHTIEEVLSCARTSYPHGSQPPLAAANRIVFNRALARAFPAGTKVSSMLLLGDLQARVGQSFAQEAWTGAWSDARIGNTIVAQYQQATSPITANNAGALNERWAVIFLTSTTFRVVGQTLGQIATGDVNTNCAPANPASGQPYFTIPAVGWGTGWSAGNVLRFNTTGANAAVWVARAVLPSAPNSTPDSLTVAVRGDIDA